MAVWGFCGSGAESRSVPLAEKICNNVVMGVVYTLTWQMNSLAPCVVSG